MAVYSSQFHGEKTFGWVNRSYTKRLGHSSGRSAVSNVDTVNNVNHYYTTPHHVDTRPDCHTAPTNFRDGNKESCHFRAFDHRSTIG